MRTLLTVRRVLRRYLGVRHPTRQTGLARKAERIRLRYTGGVDNLQPTGRAATGSKVSADASRAVYGRAVNGSKVSADAPREVYGGVALRSGRKVMRSDGGAGGRSAGRTGDNPDPSPFGVAFGNRRKSNNRTRASPPDQARQGFDVESAAGLSDHG